MFARRIFSRVVNSRVGGSGSKRGFSGHAEPVPTEGIDGFVRKYIPKDEYLALAILGAYYVIYKVGGMMMGKAPVEVVAAPTTTDGGMPSIDSAEFGDWISKDGNLEKMLTAV
jgi:hypothetical protein